MDGIIHVNQQQGIQAIKRHGTLNIKINQPEKGLIYSIIGFRLIIKKYKRKRNILKPRSYRIRTINGVSGYWKIKKNRLSSVKVYRSLPLYYYKRMKLKDKTKQHGNRDRRSLNNTWGSTENEKLFTERQKFLWGKYLRSVSADKISTPKNDKKKVINEKSKLKFPEGKNKPIESMKNDDNQSPKLKQPSKIGDFINKYNFETPRSCNKISESGDKFNFSGSGSKSTLKNRDRKSNIPVLKRNVREFEDITSSRESTRRSLIPQRLYRGSTDDLRRYRDDSNSSSLIPKLSLFQKNKDDRIKRIEEKDNKEKPISPSISAINSKIELTHITQYNMEKKVCSQECNSMMANEAIMMKKDEENKPDMESFNIYSLNNREENLEDEKKREMFKIEELQTKGFKEELLNNTDDTDDTTNRRSSSHLSPEASPLSTRSSRYSPRESESEPTPGLPRKITASESFISSQRIRDAITRSRRESNNSARYESSGSESIRLNESGLYDYVDLGKKTRSYESNYYDPRSCAENSKRIQRDSATSAGEDDFNEQCLSRSDSNKFSNVSSQGRTILRRRRQFDSQGSRRRGRSYARSFCNEELPNLPITRQPNFLRSNDQFHGQDLPNPDYRRLVFISSDSSSGREEDDADSSCSGSSYLTGLPRNSHAQNLEDCDWDYFESESLRLPSILPSRSKSRDITDLKDSKNAWDCCLGRGSGACLACGNSSSRNVLPVPVPIPVPVPYPVPVPASLWNNGDFAAAASSMITTCANSDNNLSLKNVPSITPWFSWPNPKFNPSKVHRTSLHCEPQIIDQTFDSSFFTFHPSEISFARYGHFYDKNLKISSSSSASSSSEKSKLNSSSDIHVKQLNCDEEECQENKSVRVKIDKLKKTEGQQEMIPLDVNFIQSDKSYGPVNSNNRNFNKDIIDESSLGDEDYKLVQDNSEVKETSLVSLANESIDTNQIVCCLSRGNSTSSSDNSSASSSDLEDSAPHRFSRVFVVNDDSLASDSNNYDMNDHEDNDDDDDDNDDDDDDDDDDDVNDGVMENNIVLKRISQLPDTLSSSLDFQRNYTQNKDQFKEKISKIKNSKYYISANRVSKTDESELIEHNEIYVADSDDCSDNHVKLKSIRQINPDEIELSLFTSEKINNDTKKEEDDTFENNSDIFHACDSSVVPDSLEIDTISDQKCTRSISSLSTIRNNETLNSSKLDKNQLESIINEELIKNHSETLPCIESPQLKRNDGEINNDNDTLLKNDETLIKKIESITLLKEVCKTENCPSLSSSSTSSSLSSSTQRPNDHDTTVGNEKAFDSQQVGENKVVDGVVSSNGTSENGGETVVRGTARFRSVERRPPTRKENAFLSSKASIEGAYQPVSVITSDTTTLLQPDESQSSQGLAGYYHLALEALTETNQRNGQGPKRPLTVKRLVTTSNEQQVDGGSNVENVGSVSESDDVQFMRTNNIKHTADISPVKENRNLCDRTNTDIKNDTIESIKSSSPQSSKSGENVINTSDTVILEEGLADDDSWVEEVSHDEDEQSGTTLTEESSEDEVNNLGDREEELRGYHRQAIDFTLHTIVEESCEESEAEFSLNSGNWKKKTPRPPSTSELEKYFFFGLGGDINSISNNKDGNHLNKNNENIHSFSNNNIFDNDSTINNDTDDNCDSNNSKNDNEGLNTSDEVESNNDGISSQLNQEADSFSETCSVYSEGLESLGHDNNGNNSSGNDKSANDFANCSRLEKYFLSEFLGFNEDRRDSDGSVGSDSEGRPSPEAQRRKRLVRARGTGRSHSSSLDNLLALTQSGQNLSLQNSLQDLSINQDSADTHSDDSSVETADGQKEDGQTAVFGAEGQFDTVKRKKKKSRNLGTQSPRVVEDRNKSPEIQEENCDKFTEVSNHNPNESQTNNSSDEKSKSPQPESISNTLSSTPITDFSNHQNNNDDNDINSVKQQSRDSGFVGSCDDLIHHQKLPNDQKTDSSNKDNSNNLENKNGNIHNNDPKVNLSGTNEQIKQTQNNLSLNANVSLSRKDSFNNWSSDEETNLMMSKVRQFFKTMVANSNIQSSNATTNNSSVQQLESPVPSPSLSGVTSNKSRISIQNRTKPPQLVYFENELTRLMKTVPGIKDEQVREIVEYLSSEDTWSDSYDSSDYTSSDLEGAAGGRRSALQEQISQSCQQIINKFDINSVESTTNVIIKNNSNISNKKNHAGKSGNDDDDEDDDDDEENNNRHRHHHHHHHHVNNSNKKVDKKEDFPTVSKQACMGRDTAFVYQKLVQSFTKMAGDNISSDASSTPHSSPPLIAKVMHHIGSRLVALMHQVSENNPSSPHHSSWRRYPQHNRTPSSASTTEDDDSTSDSNHTPSFVHYQLPRSKSHDPLLLISGHPTTGVSGQESEERETSDYERFSWRGSFESALMATDSRTKLSLLTCSGDINASTSASANSNALAMAAKRRSAGDLLFSPKSFSREQLDRVRSCGSIGAGGGTNNDNNVNETIGFTGDGNNVGGSVEDKIWNNRRRSSVPDANARGDIKIIGDHDDEDDDENDEDEDDNDDTEDEFEFNGNSRATTLPRGMQTTINSVTSNTTTNSLPRLPGSTSSNSGIITTSMHKAHSMYHFLPQHTGVKSARYRPPGFARNSLSNNNNGSGGNGGRNGNNSGIGPKRALSAPGLQIASSQNISIKQRQVSRSRRREPAVCLVPDDGSSLSEACSTPIIGGSNSKLMSSRTMIDIDDLERQGLHSDHNTRASLSSLGARSDSMASVYSGAGEGKWCGSVAVRGEVEFSLQYDYKQLTFQVHVSQCKDLAPVDIKRNRSDPYVKVYLLPDKSKGGKRKTKVKKHTLNPVFDETLKFHINVNALETRTLWLTVWHSDMFGRNDFLGEVRMPLENKIFDDPTPRWYLLQERSESFDDPVITYKGEVIVGLKFVPPDPVQLERERDSGAEQRLLNKGKKNWSKGSLHVLVKEARHLQTRSKNSGTCDPFCKSYLLPDKGRSGKQKTNVVRKSDGSPVWGHTFVYKDVSLQELAERGLELTVWDHDRIASNEFLGGVRFNLGTGKHYGKPVDWMDATGRELSLWQSMLERPNFWVEGAITLRPNLYNHGKHNFS
ncbi:uncharacterized protein [Chelonus insularis]|uniref:uncharacterized protein isoform X2 n=1 Tax=Chelonus insularis TaxID=460826 RepID=UPI001588660D|nr:uncharacterized protein LOC118073557 isoform X2 [Chelonus insularis]